MTMTVVGLFDDVRDAEAVVRDLVDQGFSREDISVAANDARGELANRYGSRQEVGGGKLDHTEGEQAVSGAVAGAGVGAGLGLLVGLGIMAIPGIGPIAAAGPLAGTLGTVLGTTGIGAAAGAVTGGLIGPLVDAGIPRPEAEVYAEGVRRGGTLVLLTTSDDRSRTAIDIMNRHNVVDIEQRAKQYRDGGWTGYDERQEPYKPEDLERFRQTRGQTRSGTDRDATVLPVIEEDVQVGTRQVQTGGARIHTRVTEQPVEEQAHLREEHLKVERRPADRPLGDAENAFEEQSFEVAETQEEPVVRKQARVVEEVVVDKDVEEHTETIRDTARRQDVDVQDTTTRGRATARDDFDAFDKDFRNHYRTHAANSGYDYEQYRPVYRYGYDLAHQRANRGRSWNDIEGDARRRWEERNPGTWEQFKASIRYAWERATNPRSSR